MPKFITRIHLLNADRKDYQHLQEEMKKESFHVVRSTASRKALDTAEYAVEGNLSLSDATDATWRAARRTGKKYTFTIIRQKMGYEFDRALK